MFIKRNPQENKEFALADAAYRHFHGKDSEIIITDRVDWPPPQLLQDEYGPFWDIPKNIGALGELTCLEYEDEDTLEDELIEFDDPLPLLCSDYKAYGKGRESLYIIGGKYKVPKSPSLICGPLIWVEYSTVKSFDDFKPTLYKHRFFEPFPILAHNLAGTQLYIIRDESEFYIDRVGGVSAGIAG